MGQYELQQFSENGDVGDMGRGKGASDGIRIKAGTGLILVFLAIASAVGVGLIVHFAENRTLECTYPDGGPAVVNQGGNSGQQHGGQVAKQTTATASATPKKTATITETSATPIATKAPPMRNIRLPRSFSPSHYVLKLKPNLYNDEPATFTFDGSVEITITSKAASRNVTLHITQLNITEGSITFKSKSGASNSPRFTSYSVDEELEFLTIHLDRETTPGSEYTLSMQFVGRLKDDLRGLYYSSYKRGNQTMYIATTQFETTDARKAFPCFDEPALKATFKVTLVRKRHVMSLSNMRITNQNSVADDFVEDVYETTRKMSTYLLAFIVGEFSHTNMTVPGTNVMYGAWARPGMAEQTRYGLEVGAKTTANYNKFFNISFPLPKQDMIGLPDFGAGAMENWGLVTYREVYMLFEEGVSSEKQRQNTAAVIAHELAHQWFGNLVTLEWWGDVWLNEGFARFVQYLGVDMLYSDWNMLDQFVPLAVHSALEIDSHVSSHALSIEVKSTSDIHFDHIAYAKGGSIIRMVRFILGEGTFNRGLNRYLNAHAYDNANHNDLWKAFSEQCAAENKPIDIATKMAPWTVQMNYPLVTVVRGENKLRITQERFLKNKNAEDTGESTSQFGYQWQIPLTVVSSSSPDFDVTENDINWITEREQDVSMPGLGSADWIIANAHQYGFYRVNYEESNWRALIQQLKSDHTVFPTTNRAQMINDAWSLARAGDLSTRLALGILEYLGSELDYVPWVTAQTQISYLDSVLRQTELYGQFQTFMASRLRAPYKQFGLSRQNSTHIKSLTRSVVADLACKLRLPECLQESQRLFDQWMAKPDTNPIDADVRAAVYCSAIGEGGAVEWEFAFRQYQAAQAITERNRLMVALGCTRVPWLLARYLQLCLTPSVVRKQDAVYVMTSISQHSTVGQLLTWDFLRENWDYMFNDYGKDSMAFKNLLRDTTSTFSTSLHLKQLKVFQAENPDLGRVTPFLNRAIEEVMTNINWIDNNLDTVSNWLTNVATSQSESRVTDVRLPRHIVPTMYDVTLKPMMYNKAPETFTFEGHVKIYMTANAPGRNVTLHANVLEIIDSSVSFKADSDDNGPAYKVGSMRKDAERQFRVFELDKPVKAGSNYTIEMDFTSPLRNDLIGLFYSEYKRGNDTIYLTVSHFEPTDARKAFPCFDEPQLKAEFNVKLIRKAELKSLSNMPIANSRNIEDDFVVDTYERSRKMSTYLLVFVVCDFNYTEGTTERNTTYRAWSRPEAIEQTTVALDTGIKVLSYYEDYFNITFPLPKQDMIAIPDYPSGAMEHWGLITYRETNMLYRPGVSSAKAKQKVEATVAHELAHQWFGDLVTMTWWDDIWLNEGFAAFVEYMGTDIVSPSFHMFDQFVADLHDVFDVDALVTSHPIFVPLQNPDEIHEIFDTISYYKGASVIRMMRFFLGEETFKKGVQIYLKAKAYDNADHDDLWAGLQTQANMDKKPINVMKVMDTWIKQMNYPVVMVTKAANGKVQVSQSRFLSNANAVDPENYVSPFGYQWQIPFTFTSKADSRFNQTDKDAKWINTTTVELSTMYPTSGWILGNIQQFGVYRVNYDEANWRLLIQQLVDDHTAIHTVNRAQIINDAFGLVKAEQLSMSIALSTLGYLDHELAYMPWHAAARELDYMTAMLAETGAYGDFQKFLQKKVATQFGRLGIQDNGTDHLQSLLRSTIASYACGSGTKACITQAQALFKQYQTNPQSNPISAGLKTTVYCTAVREGDEAEWNFVFDQYSQETLQEEKSRLLYALTCTKEIWILNKLFHMSMNSSIVRSQDAAYLFIYAAETPVGRCVAWDFFRANFDTILDMYGSVSFHMTNLIRGLTSSFTTDFALQQLKDFHELHPDMGTGTRAFIQAIEKTAANVQWVDKYYTTVQAWLANNL